MAIESLTILHGLMAAIGVGVGAGAVALWAVPRLIRAAQAVAQAEGQVAQGAAAHTAMENTFHRAAASALQASQEQFLALATERFKNSEQDHAHDFDERQKAIAQLVDPVAKSLNDVAQRLNALGASGAVLDAHLKNFTEDQRLLRQQTQNLVQVLKNSTARGQWGEMQLARTLELVGMVENVHFRQQVNVTGDGAAQRPDFIIHLPGHLSIVIDVKAPLDPYWAANDALDNVAALNDEQLQAFRGHLRNHVRQLSGKAYWQQFDSPQFVVMFLPTEGLFSLAVASDKTLIEDAAAAQVILASPTTILGLLRVVMYAWQQQSLAENARAIGQMATDLNGRMGTFLDHLQKLGRNLGTAVNAYNAAVGTVEARVLPQLRKIEEFQGQTSTQLPEITPLDTTPRQVTMTTAMDDKAA